MSQLKTITVALVGNPNTGKTTLFNALSGLRQRVGNYPGVTVEMKKGRLIHDGSPVDLIDLPGTYSLAPRSPDEMVAVDLLLGRQAGEPRPDAVISIVDAGNLERNLYLTTQILEMGVPVVVALNMVDVAEAHGVRVDAGRLSAQLGVPVVPIQANAGKGIAELTKAAVEAASAGKPPPLRPEFPEAFEREAAALRTELGGGLPEFLVRRLLLDVGGHTERRLAEGGPPQLAEHVAAARKRLAEAGAGVPAVEARTRYGWLRKAVAGCITRPDTRPVTWTDRIDAVLTHRLWGTVVFLAVMFVMFQAIFTWAGPLMDLIGEAQDGLSAAVAGALGPGPLTSLLTDGVIAGVGGVLVFLPQILILFAFVAVLEDCGYMARAAFLMDRLMSRCGLSGKSFIPLLSSVACAIPGILATRVIENRRDRLATILVAPLMSCSARLPVYILIIGTFLPVRGDAHPDGYPWWVPGAVLFAMYLIGFVVAPLVALVLKSTLLRGETPVFVLEMPVYKRPSVPAVLRRMADAGLEFVQRAGTVILATMVIVWGLLYFPRGEADGVTFPERIAQLEEERDALLEQLPQAGEDGREPAIPAELQPIRDEADALDERLNDLRSRWKAQSWLGRAGHLIEPAVRPLGWDWKVGMAALASFPAREVVVGTLGTIYAVGEDAADEVEGAEDVAGTALGRKLLEAEFDDQPGRKVFTIPTALSLMVFFALCAQCASTLAVIRRETGSWGWPVFTFVYMTGLAYVGAMAVYQIGTALAGT